MIDFVINTDELAAMSGLPHAQQIAYLRGIRPYMDVKTGITGIKCQMSTRLAGWRQLTLPVSS